MTEPRARRLSSSPSSRLSSHGEKIIHRKRSRVAVLTAVAAVGAATGLAAASLWPAGGAPHVGASAAQIMRAQAADVFTPPDVITFDARRQRPGALESSVHAKRLRFVAEQARRAAEMRAAARAAALAAQQREAAAQPSASSPPSSVPAGSAQQIASAMLGGYGWGQDQFGCLDALWGHESGWSATASNPSTGAYGIPQALPGSKMASAGSDWQTSAATQIRWGLGYIQGLYGSPCAAWSHEQATGWY